MGKTLNLLVLFRGGYTPLDATWSRSGPNGVMKKVEQGERVTFSGQHSLNLTMTNVTLEDEGGYVVNVSNEVGSVILMYTVSVLGKGI